MGNVYMEADQVRFKSSTYRDVQAALAAALEGGGGGGTTVVANPEGSATADLAKLQVGETIYGIPAEAGDISYDNTSSGMTADDVQEAIDELNTGLSGVTELIPSGATSSNKLATADDIPDAVTGNPSGTATAGNLTKLQIGSDIYNVPSGGSNIYGTYAATEEVVGEFLGETLYRKVYDISNPTFDASNSFSIGGGGDYDPTTFFDPLRVSRLDLLAYSPVSSATYSHNCVPIPWTARSGEITNQISVQISANGAIYIGAGSSAPFTIDRLRAVIEYTKAS